MAGIEPRTEVDPVALAKARESPNVVWGEEYERMISGMLYDGGAPELRAGRFHGRKFNHQYNDHFPADATVESLGADRRRMLEAGLGRIGSRVTIEPPFRVDYGFNTHIGDDFFSNYNLTILDCGLVAIGNRVVMGPDVSVYAITHDTDVGRRRDRADFCRGVTIGDDCWIGGNVTILDGVTIGRGCTIGAGSLVTKDVPEFSVAMGSPARVTRTVERVE